jgi:hypothetical protein
LVNTGIIWSFLISSIVVSSVLEIIKG